MFESQDWSIQGINFMNHFHEFREYEDKKHEMYAKKFESILKDANKEKLLKSVHRSESQSYKRVVDTLQLLSLMGSDMRSMIEYIELHEKSSTVAIHKSIDEVYRWISSMEIMYDQMESDIDRLMNRSKAFELNKFIGEVSDRIQDAVRATMDYDFLSSHVLDQAHEVSGFIRKMADLKISSHEKGQHLGDRIRERIKKSSVRESSNTGVYFLLVVVLGIAGVIYYRVNRISNKSHIL
jgi:hypothetical protein